MSKANLIFERLIAAILVAAVLATTASAANNQTGKPTYDNERISIDHRACRGTQ